MSVGSGASFTKALLRSGKKNCMRIVVDSLSFPKTPPGLALSVSRLRRPA